MNLDFLALSINNLRRRRLRSWLTMIGIFIGIAAVVALISLGQGLEQAIQDQFQEFGSDRIIIQERGLQGPPGSGTAKSTKLTEQDLKVTKNVNGVEGAAGIIVKTAKIEHNNEINFVFVFGLPLGAKEKDIVSFFNVEQGRELKEGDKDKAVVGVRYTEGKVFSKEVNIGDKINIEGRDFRIVGVLERIGNPFDDSAIIIDKEAIKEIYEIEDEESMIHAKVSNVDDIAKVKEDIEKELRKSRGEEKGKETFQVNTADQLLQSFSNIFAIVQAVLVGIAAISLVVGGIGVMNTMYTSVLERTREIGIMKAIGAKNSDVLTLFLFESGLIGLIGGFIGVAIGLGLSKIAEYFATIQLGTNLLKASTDPFLIIGALIFSFVIGTLSGVFPAMQASRLNPVDALRYE
ncbi:ABC transporter permease [Candidatus Pacearchaeota archaeon]|nr:ABC transporter permease [Candidatus Pacearchaeota archaeon]